MTVQKKKKKSIPIRIASEKQNYKYIREDNEETSFSCDVGVCVRVPMSFSLQCVEGLVYPLE